MRKSEAGGRNLRKSAKRGIRSLCGKATWSDDCGAESYIAYLALPEVVGEILHGVGSLNRDILVLGMRGEVERKWKAVWD